MKRCANVVLLFLLAVAVIAGAQSGRNELSLAQETQKRGYWVDPSTGLMWAAKDNGKDISWYKAVKYCRNLQIGGYNDWRLATLDELRTIYDPRAEAAGRAGHGKGRDFTWNVKGDLFLTGVQWSNNRIPSRFNPAAASGYGWYFDFNQGCSVDEQLGYYEGKRALCVRRSRE